MGVPWLLLLLLLLWRLRVWKIGLARVGLLVHIGVELVHCGQNFADVYGADNHYFLLKIL
jgi:hypothetical protein